MRMSAPLTLLLVLLASQASLAADINNGKALHNANCLRCHDASVYQRGEDGRVHSLAALEKQVRRCEQMLELTWFEDQVADVTHYLNATYYKFE